MPWQLLARRTGAELRFIPVDDRGLYVLDDLDALLGRLQARRIRSRQQHAGNDLAARDESYRAPTPPARSSSSTVRKGRRICRSTSKRSTPTFYTFSGHKMLGPTGIGVLYGKRALLEAMPPFFSGGDMIRKVEYAETTFADPPWKFEAGTSNIADAIAFGVATEYLEQRWNARGCANTSDC